MFHYLKGRVIEKLDGQLLIEVGGIGFLINVSEDTVLGSASGEEIELYTSVVFRGDVFEIFGFTELQDRQLFEVLKTIDSVGPRLAFRIISRLGKKGIIEAVKKRNSAFLETVEGIGKKTASKILLELSSKLEKIVSIQAVPSGGANLEVVRMALEQLGLTKAEVSEVLSELDFSKNQTPEEIVQEALKIYRSRRKL
jgi:Holliday junction DNA helicase RuvA